MMLSRIFSARIGKPFLTMTSAFPYCISRKNVISFISYKKNKMLTFFAAVFDPS